MDGLHVPEINSFETDGSEGIDAPIQYGPTGSKLGTVPEFIVIVIEALSAHCPAFGVNVYVVVERLFIPGDQDPVTPFVELFGKGCKVAPVQTGFT
jgi:hypothetical protein